MAMASAENEEADDHHRRSETASLYGADGRAPELPAGQEAVARSQEPQDVLTPAPHRRTFSGCAPHRETGDPRVLLVARPTTGLPTAGPRCIPSRPTEDRKEARCRTPHDR